MVSGRGKLRRGAHRASGCRKDGLLRRDDTPRRRRPDFDLLLGVAAIVNAPPGPLAVTLRHAKYGVTAPFTATTGAGPVTVDVIADTLTSLYVACLPH